MAERKAGTAVAARPTADLAVRPEGLPMEISAGTIRVPKIKKGEPMAAAVKNGDAGFLDIYTTTGQDDANPHVIGKADPKVGTKPGNAVRFHVLAVREGRSETVDGELVSYTLQGGRWISSYDGREAGENAYVTQTYTVCLPEVDTETPYELMLYRTSLPAARNINTALVQHLNEGGAQYELAFELSVAKRENAKFSWGIFQAKVLGQESVREEDVASAHALASRIASILPKTPAAPVDRPEI